MACNKKPQILPGPNFHAEWGWPKSYLSGRESWSTSGATSHLRLLGSPPPMAFVTLQTPIILSSASKEHFMPKTSASETLKLYMNYLKV